MEERVPEEDTALRRLKLPSKAVSDTLLLPGLPNDLALLCLARLPPSMHAPCRCVSLAWYHALIPSYIGALRRSFGLAEPWIFFCFCFETNESPMLTSWTLLDPLLLRKYVMPPPPQPSFGFSCMQGLVAGRELLVAGIDVHSSAERRSSNLHEVFCFDLVKWQWSRAPPPMEVSRRQFACAGLGDFGYVAGGSSDGNSTGLVTAERFNFRKRRWEKLPDMIEARCMCSGFVMDERFFVIGGKCNELARLSGEYFDPRTGKWTLVADMWPPELGTEVEMQAPIVAVVNDQLYALGYANAIMAYDKLTNTWKSLGYYAAQLNVRTIDYRLIGVGDELWMIETNLDKKLLMVAAKPHELKSRDLPMWSPLKFKFGGEETDLLTKCLVMV